MEKIKIISAIFIVIIIANLILFSFRRTSAIYFWGIIILCAVAAYLIPRLRKSFLK